MVGTVQLVVLLVRVEELDSSGGTVACCRVSGPLNCVICLCIQQYDSSHLFWKLSLIAHAFHTFLFLDKCVNYIHNIKLRVNRETNFRVKLNDRGFENG